MDPIAHTFFGATLAETGLKKKTRYGTATLIAGANLPDIDAVATFLGRDMSLYLRRGWTHGILAMVFLPLILAAIIWWFNKRKPPQEHEPKFDLKWVVGLAYLGTWSHPLLDLMNTYGVRLLMPFDGRWFYGDTLFIMDPWFWLMTGAAMVLAYSGSRRAKTIWVLLVAATSALVAFGPTPIAAKVLWSAGILLIALARRQKASPQTTARIGLSALIMYIGATFALARIAEQELRLAFPDAVTVASGPVPAVPYKHRVITHTHEGYYILEPDGDRRLIPFGPVEHPAVKKAKADPSIRGFVNWMRFPNFEVEEGDAGTTVIINDVRYVGPGEETRGIGRTTVHVP